MQIMQEQNDFQYNKILELIHYLNLSMLQIHEQYSILYKLDMKILIFTKTLLSSMEDLGNFRYMLSVLTDVKLW